MVRKQLIATLVGVGLAVGCMGMRSNDLPVSSFTTCAAVAAEAARVVRVVDADTYILRAHAEQLSGLLHGQQVGSVAGLGGGSWCGALSVLVPDDGPHVFSSCE